MQDRKRKSIIFDLDGTTVDTLESLAKTGNTMLETLGFPPRPTDDYRYFSGNGAKVLVERALKASGAGDEVSLMEACELYNRCFSEHCCYKVRPYEGLPEILQRLRDRGFHLFILTNKGQVFADRVIRTAYPDNPFDGVFGQRRGRPLKPDKEAAVDILEQWKLHPEDVIFVGDTSVDMEMAKHSGFHSIGVLWGSRGREELLQAGAEKLIADPSELEAAIDSFL